MTPETRTGLRRVITVIAGAAQACVAYLMHTFAGWTWWAMFALCAALLFIVIRLTIEEGRERERAERGQIR
jgi:peptidoglycan/LPS O-acetylase OafA/YrhL